MIEIIKGAISQLTGNKLRTFLTMLGMLIGISAVIIILGVGEGMKGFVNSQFASVGRQTIQIGLAEYKEENMITHNDLIMLEELPQVKAAMPCHNGYMGIALDHEKKEKFEMLIGITHNYEEVQSLNMKYGRMITKEDQELRSNVVIVEDNYSKLMYGKEDPKYALGKIVEINIDGENQEFEVIGICKSQYPVGTPEEYIMPICYMPFETLDTYFFDGANKSYEAYVIIEDEYEPTEYTKIINRLLERNHAKKDIYNVSAIVESASSYNKIVDTLQLFISMVAGVSLLVGGIGIMNIMLVTVRERTREIGIRKALGATDRQILTQFLIEALILTGLGGITGLLIGYIGSIFLASILTVEAKLTFGMIIFAVGSSSIIGIIFGVYPAYKAAKMDPVEALRQE